MPALNPVSGFYGRDYMAGSYVYSAAGHDLLCAPSARVRWIGPSREEQARLITETLVLNVKDPLQHHVAFRVLAESRRTRTPASLNGTIYISIVV